MQSSKVNMEPSKENLATMCHWCLTPIAESTSVYRYESTGLLKINEETGEPIEKGDYAKGCHYCHHGCLFNYQKVLIEQYYGTSMYDKFEEGALESRQYFFGMEHKNLGKKSNSQFWEIDGGTLLVNKRKAVK